MPMIEWSSRPAVVRSDIRLYQGRHTHRLLLDGRRGMIGAGDGIPQRLDQ
jgi:hypothetical protein